MKFAEALKALQVPSPPDARPFHVALVCGCTANHLQVFLTAHLRALAPDRQMVVQTGVYGDCLGNLDRLAQAPIDGAAVVLEWSDLDPRLGIRQTGGWSPGVLSDILQNVDAQAARFQDALTRAAARASVAVCMPTLPLPPVAYTPSWQCSTFESQLRMRLGTLAAEVVRQPNVRLVNSQRLDQRPPPGDRLDVRTEFLS